MQANPEPARPAALFGMILGLIGLGNDWRMAARLWRLPPVAGEAIMLGATAIWFFLLVSYARAWLRVPQQMRHELDHAVQRNFVVLVPVSTMLVALAVAPYGRGLAVAIYVMAAIATLAVGVWLHSSLWSGGLAPGAVTHAHYFPTVAGNLVASIVASGLGFAEIARLFLGAGILAWLSIESVVLHRLLVGEPLPPQLRTTLGIQLAPPAVALVGYMGASRGTPDLLAYGLLGYALLQALLLARLMPWIRAQPFGPGYWSFSFGLSAMALGAGTMLERGGGGVLQALAPALFAVANVVIGALVLRTALAVALGRYLPGSAGVPADTVSTASEVHP